MNALDIRELSDADLDVVSGGWQQCLNGTTAGGPAGLYPDYAECRQTLGELITDAATKNKKTLQQSGGGTGGRPA